MRSTAGALVVADDEPEPCLCCKGPLRVQKTFRHHGATLEHGRFQVRETVYICSAGCQQDGHPVRQRQRSVAQLLVPRGPVGYDVMTFVGLQRFVHYRQCESIRAELQQKYDIPLSSGEVSALGRRFLVYLEALHHARAPQLRKALEQDGGWPLHMDATGENGQGTVLVVYAGWRGWALGAWKIPTERADAILPKLRTIETRFGAPCGVMRDFGKAVIEAARDFVGERTIPVFGCHLHFTQDIGKDLLRDSHDQLRKLFRRFAVVSRLRTLARDLGRGIGVNLERARRDVASWLGGTDERYLMPKGNAGLATVRALAQWVLDYPDDGTDAGFPFDRPSLDLYCRCLRACRAAESLLRKPWDDRPVHQALERLHRIVELVSSELPFQRPAQILEARACLFDELRDALRLRPKQSTSLTTAAPEPERQRDEIRDVQKTVEALEASLQQRRPQRGPAQDMRKAIDLILDHLHRHGPSLWGHVIALPPDVGGGIRLVERTNVLLESFFHEIKHGERRRSGRKILTQDFEHLPAAAVLARNLTKPDYVAIVCGTIDNLPRAFANLDAASRTLSLPARTTRSAGSDQPEVISSSLPKADRNLVRTQAMRERVLAETRSRATRTHPARAAGASGNRRLTP